MLRSGSGEAMSAPMMPLRCAVVGLRTIAKPGHANRFWCV